MVNPSQGDLNTRDIMSVTNLCDKVASDKISFARSSQRGIGLDLHSSFLTERNDALRIFSHTDMELDLVDSRHQHVSCLVSRREAFKAFLAEVGDSNRSSFLLVVQLLESLPLIFDFHAVQRSTATQWRKMYQEKINIVNLKFIKVLLMGSD